MLNANPFIWSFLELGFVISAFLVGSSVVCLMLVRSLEGLDTLEQTYQHTLQSVTL